MNKKHLLTLIWFFITHNCSIWGQSTQIGFIDFYGTITNKEVLRKCLPFTENDVVQFLTDAAYPTTKQAIIDCLLSQPKIRQADISFVCCTDQNGQWIVFVGIDSTLEAVSQNTKTDDIQLPEEITSMYDSLINLIRPAIEKGEGTEDHTNGHSLMKYLPARQLQQEFIMYANEHLEVLKEVLQKSKYAGQRAAAATVIAYYHDKSAIVNDLLNAVSDPSEEVRNNAIRAIGILAEYSVTHPDLNIDIPAQPFIDMMNSISWTDRNKSSLVLLSLTTSRNHKLLAQLKQQALQPIINMATWKSYSHSIAGYIMLGRIAGWSDEEIMEGANANKAASIERMLADIH